jgi:starvation-inducible outer membrane lipoprotein
MTKITKMKNLVALLLVFSFALSGCVVLAEPPAVRVVVPGPPAPHVVIINDERRGFCPPGQAKKGRC